MLVLASAAAVHPQKKVRTGTVCGDPTATCKGGDTFQPYDLPFDTGKNFVIGQSNWFYGIVLRSKKTEYFGDCEKPAFAEPERLALQKLFPKNKVFALNCIESGSNYYTGVVDNTVFVAVYAGKTLAEAYNFLKVVQQQPEFKSVRVRRMRIEINGT